MSKVEINDELIERLSRLAKLEFNAVEREEIISDLQQMLSFVGGLDQLDLGETETLLNVVASNDRLRPDEVQKLNDKNDILSGSPGEDTDFFSVPKVIE